MAIRYQRSNFCHLRPSKVSKEYQSNVSLSSKFFKLFEKFLRVVFSEQNAAQEVKNILWIRLIFRHGSTPNNTSTTP